MPPFFIWQPMLISSLKKTYREIHNSLITKYSSITCSPNNYPHWFEHQDPFSRLLSQLGDSGSSVGLKRLLTVIKRINLLILRSHPSSHWLHCIILVNHGQLLVFFLYQARGVYIKLVTFIIIEELVVKCKSRLTCWLAFVLLFQLNFRVFCLNE